MIPYPNEFPREALAMALDLARGNSPDIKEAIHACWVVSGYALGQTLGGGPIVTCDAETVDPVTVLEQAMLHDSNSVAVQGLFPWLLVLRIVLKLIADYGEKL